MSLSIPITSKMCNQMSKALKVLRSVRNRLIQKQNPKDCCCIGVTSKSAMREPRVGHGGGEGSEHII